MHQLTTQKEKCHAIKRLMLHELVTFLSTLKLTANEPLIITNASNFLPCENTYRHTDENATSHGLLMLQELKVVSETTIERVVDDLLNGHDQPDETMNQEVLAFLQRTFGNDERYQQELSDVKVSQVFEYVYNIALGIIYESSTENLTSSASQFEEEVHFSTDKFTALAEVVLLNILNLSFLHQEIAESDGVDLTAYFANCYVDEISYVQDHSFSLRIEGDDYSFRHLNPVRGGGFSCTN